MCAQILALTEADDTAQNVVQSLKASGHSVILCESFAAAIELLREQREIDLIMSDVHLENGGNVFDFLRWVKRSPSSLSSTPFVLFSCNPSSMALHLEDGVRTSARMLGAAKYISMASFDSEAFRTQIDAVLPDGDTTWQLEPVENAE